MRSQTKSSQHPRFLRRRRSACMRLQHRISLALMVTSIGSVCGAAAGAAIATTILTVSRHPSLQLASELYAVGLQSGALLGAVLGPLSAFTILRRVPLGRLFWFTALSTVAGGLAAFTLESVVAGRHHNIPLLI